MLVHNLPRESAYVQAVAGPGARWGDAEHLLAIIADRVAIGPWQWAARYRKKNSPEPKRPEPIRRPGAAKSAGRITMRPGELARMLKGGG